MSEIELFTNRMISNLTSSQTFDYTEDHESNKTVRVIFRGIWHSKLNLQMSTSYLRKINQGIINLNTN